MAITKEQLFDIADKFAFDAPVVDISTLGLGFINDTFIVTTEGSRYILQRKNHHIFPDVPRMMDNIERVTKHLKAKVAAAGGYIAIFSTTQDQPASAGLAYFDPSQLTDITPAVKTELNIQ